MDKLKYFFIGELLNNEVNPYEKAKIETNYCFSFFGFICFFSVFLIAFFIEANIISAATFPKVIFYSLGLEATVAVFIIFYLLNTFIKTNRQIAEELKISNEHLEEQNKLVNEQHHEKIIMLKEIHHRVKNNLQVVSSMLRLQSDKIASDEVKVIFDDAQHRIQAMAMVHQRMYQTENLAKIDLATYIKELATDLTSLHATTQDVSLDIDTNIPELNVKNIVPLGLIINELISNSLKHGIKTTGNISLSFNKLGGNLLFIYKDNGLGFDDETLKKGFGMELIDVFASQMDSNYKVESQFDKGLTYEFNIPLN